MAVSQGATSKPLAFGAGYGHPNGSLQVREVQRLLLSIGYRPGPVDGLYGPLTRASVQWFQLKHSLRPSGAVDAATLALLRMRSRGASPSETPTTAPPQPAGSPQQPANSAKPAVPASAPTAAPAASHAQSRKTSGSPAAPAVIVGALAALALLAATLLLLLRRRRREGPPSAPESEPPAAPKPPPVIPAQPPSSGRALDARPAERVVGYTAGRQARDLRHQAEAIERACSEHGWALAQVVRERGNGNGHRPGLQFALEQLAEGAGNRLVACRIHDVGRNRDELAKLLAWCARTGVELVALDVGLDTGTRSGRHVARSLVSPGRRARFGRPIRRRRGKAPGVDGDLAPTSSP